ncbi:MAG: sigma-70 family RNA polymerase sigma factor [Candidatus Aminicenantes bacterium]|nr:sigma-70 family RNA polymerase sigma factor [Candidatus Aminicenantes bacterium]
MTEEHDLIDRLATGDKEAFRELVEAYKKKIYYLAFDLVGNQSDAEDVSQDVFLKAYRAFGTFKRDARLGAWLYRITYNTAIDHLRRRGISAGTVDEAVLEANLDRVAREAPARDTDPARTAESELLQLRIASALEKVSPQEKTVFLLRHYDDLMLKDIADVLGLSLGSVKSYLFRAVKKLQRELGAGGPARWEVSHD